MWYPKQHNSAMQAFQASVSQKTRLSFSNYDELHAWSIQNPEAFWRSVAEFCKVQKSSIGTDVYQSSRGSLAYPGHPFLDTRFLPSWRLNFAENCLAGWRDEDVCLLYAKESEPLVSITCARLKTEVASLQAFMKSLGLAVGDRVVCLSSNRYELVVSLLAASGLGLIISTCSTEFGAFAILERFKQIEPQLFISSTVSFYKGKSDSLAKKIVEVTKGLPSLKAVIHLDALTDLDSFQNLNPTLYSWDDVTSDPTTTLYFESLPFDHPLYVVFSSGTTGTPKCLVHGAGGTLLQHKKEHVLHCDLRPMDTLSYFTTPGWMMWNWLVSALASKVRIFLYDGSPAHPHPLQYLIRSTEAQANVIGTSPKYLSMCAQDEETERAFKRLMDSPPLKTILSTGAPLLVEQFEWFYKQTDKVALHSISGGTDILSCFFLGHPDLPVCAGEASCIGLGMDVVAHGAANPGQAGELVCRTPFPSRPLPFAGLCTEEALYKSYFMQAPPFWSHGDFIQISPTTRGIKVLGRSDATLNPGGVRIGTAELYNALEGLSSIKDSLVIGIENSQREVEIVVFVVVSEDFDLELQKKIRDRIRDRCSPRHVPAHIVRVDEVPYTMSGKRVELAVQRAFTQGLQNAYPALANPNAVKHCLDALLGSLKKQGVC